MFDYDESFARQFIPVDDGYLYYPSKMSGGKLLSRQEYEEACADWRRVTGTRGMVTMVVAAVAAMVLSTSVSHGTDMSEQAKWAVAIAITLLVMVRISWAAYRPWRLFRHRADHVPPRDVA